MFVDTESQFNKVICIWQENDWDRIIIFGNGSGVLDAPVGLFWEDSIFRIGLNRSFLLGHLHCSMYIDEHPDMALNNEIRFQGEGFPLHQKGFMVKVNPTVNVYDKKDGGSVHSRFHNPEWEEALERSDNDDMSMGLFRRKNTLFPAIDLATRISKRDIPITLCGVSFDKRTHFYKDKYNQKNSNKDKNFFKRGALSFMPNEIIGYLDYLIKEGYDISYTDDSQLLNRADCRKIGYNDLNYTYD